MKRYNFSCYASEKQEAVSRTTTTKPVDFVGEARVTRFRLSRGSVPIFYLEPSVIAYTEEQKDILIASGITPTDICFFIAQFASPRNNWNPSDFPNNTCQYISGLQRRAGSVGCYYQKIFDLNKLNTVMKCCICVAYRTAPTFEKRGNNWYLTTEKYPIYDWDSLNKDTVGIKSISDVKINRKQMLLEQPQLKLQVKEENGFPLFHINLFEKYGDNCYVNIQRKVNEQTTEPYVSYEVMQAYITDPVLFMNDEALKLFGMNITEMPSVFYSPNVVGHFTDIQKFYAPPLRLKDPGADVLREHNMYYAGKITLVAEDLSVQLDENCLQYIYNTDLDPCFITVPKDIFPVSQILLTSDELDFQGESISVDTTARQGVIDPSSLHVLKSFFVGITDTVEIDASDFIFTDDNLNQSPVIINNPRICSLTFRVWFLLKTGELKKCILEPGKGFSLQIGLF